MKQLILLAILAAGSYSCVSHNELLNFNEANLPTDKPELILNAMDLTIQAEDLLRITVHSMDPLAAAPFNLEGDGQGGNRNMMAGGGNQGGGGNNLELFTGYFVDKEGYIDFPVLGRLEVAGLTLEQAKFKIYGQLQPYLKDAVINIRFLNFKITIIGEVGDPGTVRLTNKRVTLLEAIGMANDLTEYANRTNVLVIREENGERTYARLNLQSNEIFTSPYFYLQQNDVIYVEPIRARVATVADPAQRLIAYSSAVLSLITLIIALTR